MKPEQQQVFDSIPEDEPRSRLEPYRELILRWRRQGRTYRRICALLAEHYNVEMNCGALYRYVKLRVKPRNQKQEPEIEQLALTLATAPQLVTQSSLPRYATPTQTEDDPWAEARERMRKFKDEPAAVAPSKVFQVNEEDLDCTKPLRMMSPTSKEK